MADVKYKTFDAGGLGALTDFLKQVKQAASGTQTGLTSLEQKLAAILAEVGGAIRQLDESKAYIAVSMDFTLTAANWLNDEDSALYPYRYVIPLAGITSEARADVVFDAASAYEAGQCEVCPVSETETDKVILRSRKKTETELTGTLYVTRGTVSASNDEEE